MIQVTDLVKSFGKETVLHHINMNFAPGKIHGIIGRNGSGKTMLMKCICGFIPVTSGKVTVFGKVIGKDVDIPDNIGAIIETPGFLPEYGAYRNLKFLADITG
uniref:ATP-binding cassette domain-containing protein n=1 Tax=Ruminococcus sp. TaxID=41978 RepID=UPI00402767DB